MWLIGMMGSGKTTVGRLAASRLGVAFYDTDEMVVESAKMPISDIWDQAGEEQFRELERAAVARIPVSGFIAAAGGGAVLDPSNRVHISAGGPVVWLRCDPVTLARRLQDDGTRPLLTDEGPTDELLGTILERRDEIYASVATDTIDTDGRDVDEVVAAVIDIWQR